jgi:hypothetical protein
MYAYICVYISVCIHTHRQRHHEGGVFQAKVGAPFKEGGKEGRKEVIKKGRKDGRKL